MNNLRELVDEAASLAEMYSCKRDGHIWVLTGGTACMDCGKSQAVHECKYCGDCDYGEPDIHPDCASGKCAEH